MDARNAPRLWLLAATVVVALVPGCSCDNIATGPLPPGTCLLDVDCPQGQVCREGRCAGGLPPDPGEGEGEGEGDEVVLFFAPTALTLPDTAPGATSEAQAQLVNGGGAPVTLTALSSGDPRFLVVEPAVGATISANFSVPVRVRFVPAQEGSFQALVTASVGVTTATLAVSGSTGASSGEGEGEGEGAGGDGDVLVFQLGPDDSGLGLPGCDCKAPIVPAVVLLAYETPGGTCTAPQNLNCGLDDTCAPCNLGQNGAARWRAGRVEQPRQGDDPWLVAEEVVHSGSGADGVFTLKATLANDCRATVGSIGFSTNHACCTFIDCDGADAPLACYPYPNPRSCSTNCQAFVSSAMSQDCMERGPLPVRASLQIGNTARAFCAVMSRDQQLDMVRVRRTGGQFSVEGLGTGVVEVGATAPCP
jgi:hypothetical protein